MKILPNLPELSEDEAREQKRISNLQESSIQRVLSAPSKSALIGDETGFGKTLIASEIAVRAGWGRFLIIGIDATFEQWEERLALQSDGAIRLRKLASTQAGRAAFEDFLAGKPGAYMATIHWLMAQDWVHQDKKDSAGNPIPKLDKNTGQPTGKFERERVHLGIFRKMSARKDGGLDAIIFDEADAVANRSSVGRRTLLTIKAEWKVAMSATWSGNEFSHAWSLPRWLWPDEVPAYWAWHAQWCKTETKYLGGGRTVEAVVGEKEPEGSFVKTLPCYIRNEHEERAPEPMLVYVDSTPQQRAQYNDLKAELLTWVHSEMSQGREPLVVDIPAVLRTRLRQVALAELSFDADGGVAFAPGAASAKLGALRGILDQWADQPVVIFTDSKLYANLVAARMTAAGYAAKAWTGDVSSKDRQELKRGFMAGEYRYLVLTVQAGGTGLDGLQRVCSKIVWLSMPDGNPKLEEQARGRIFRPGMTTEYGPFQHVQIQMRDSVDVEVWENLLAKGKAMHASIAAK